MELLGIIVQFALTVCLFVVIFQSVLKLQDPPIGVSLKRVRLVLSFKRVSQIVGKWNKTLLQFESSEISLNCHLWE